MCSLVCIEGAATPQHHFPVQQIALTALTTTVKSTVGQVSLSQHLFPDHLELNWSSSTCLLVQIITIHITSAQLNKAAAVLLVPWALEPLARGFLWPQIPQHHLVCLGLSIPSWVSTTCDTDLWQLYPLSASTPTQIHTGHTVWAGV